MKKFEYKFDGFFFEVKFASGYLYLDRCGLSMLDIERQCEGWLAGTANPQSAKMERPDKNMVLTYNSDTFHLALHKAFKQDMLDIANEVDLLWKIIQTNFGLDEYLRVGCRFHYILPTSSIKDAEKLIAKSSFNVQIPRNLLESGLSLEVRQPTAVLRKGDLECRLQLSAVTRHEGIDPSRLLRTDPRFLSEKQNTYRLAQLKALEDYSANPLHAILFDVDCSIAKPKDFQVKEFIHNHFQIASNLFLPILEEIWKQQ